MVSNNYFNIITPYTRLSDIKTMQGLQSVEMTLWSPPEDPGGSNPSQHDPYQCPETCFITPTNCMCANDSSLALQQGVYV